MKKIIISCCIIMLCTIFKLNAQKIGERVYKEFVLNDETFSKWFEYTGNSEYNEKGEWINPNIEYDEHGNEIFHNFKEGSENYHNDKKGNLIHKIASTPDGGYEVWYEYDSKGKLIHQIQKNNTDGKEFERWYDNNDNEIQWKTSDGDFSIIEYNSNNQPIHYKGKVYGGSYEWWKEYDKYGNEILHKTSAGLVINTEYIYNFEGRKTYSKEKRSDSKNTTEKWFDEWGHEIRSKYGDSEFLTDYECDSFGNPIIVYSHNSKTYQYYEYTYWDNGIIKTKKSFFTR